MKIIGVKFEDRTGDESDFAIFDLSEVNYISVYRPRKSAELLPLYHTTSGAYAPLLTLKDISLALKNYGFEHIDKSTIVNNQRVRKKARTKNGQFQVTFIDNSEVIVAYRSRYR